MPRNPRRLISGSTRIGICLHKLVELKAASFDGSVAALVLGNIPAYMHVRWLMTPRARCRCRRWPCRDARAGCTNSSRPCCRSAGGDGLLPHHRQLFLPGRLPAPVSDRQPRFPRVAPDAARGARLRRAQLGLLALLSALRHRGAVVFCRRPADASAQRLPVVCRHSRPDRQRAAGLLRRRVVGHLPNGRGRARLVLGIWSGAGRHSAVVSADAPEPGGGGRADATLRDRALGVAVDSGGDLLWSGPGTRPGFAVTRLALAAAGAGADQDRACVLRRCAGHHAALHRRAVDPHESVRGQEPATASHRPRPGARRIRHLHDCPRARRYDRAPPGRPGRGADIPQPDLAPRCRADPARPGRGSRPIARANAPDSSPTQSSPWRSTAR